MLIFIHRINAKTLYLLKHYWQLAFIFLFVFSIYFNSIYFPFIWDDIEMIINNKTITSFNNWKHLFSQNAFGNEFEHGNFYRPIQILSYMVNFYFSELSTTAYRITSMIILSISGCLIYLISDKFKIKKPISLAISILFCVHPVHVETVTYLSGRGDVLYVCISLLTFYLYVITKTKRSVTQCIIISFFTIIAFLTKENSVILPFLLLIYEIIFNKRKKLIFPISLCFTSILYSFFRIFSSTKSLTLSWINEASLYERVCTLPYMLTEYIKLFFFPYPLHMEYHHVETSLFNPYSLTATGIIILLIIGNAISSNRKTYLFGLLWFFTCLIPVSNIILPLASTIRQHWICLAIFGLIISVTSIISTKKHIIIIPILYILIVLLSLTSYHRSSIWEDPLTLYQNDLKYEPRSFVLLNNLGYEYFKNKNYKKAEQYFYKSIYNTPKHAYDVALNNLGVIFEMKGDMKKATYYYKKSIKVGNYSLAYKNLNRLTNPIP